MQPLRELKSFYRRNGRSKWIVWGVAGLAAVLVVVVVLNVIAQRLDPYVRERTITYLEERFDSEVQAGSLRVRVPVSALTSFIPGMTGALVTVEGEDVELRLKGSREFPPIFILPHFTASVDLGTLVGPLVNQPRMVKQVVLDGMEINIPPKGHRQALHSGDDAEDAADPGAEEDAKPGDDQAGHEGDGHDVVVESVEVHNAILRIWPKELDKEPLRFDLRQIHLESAGRDVAMRYQTVMTNAKPPGEITSEGTFGPWVSGEPGDTPLAGTYLFEDADLGVFKGIAGILRSTGDFEGTLSKVVARGEASVPDFRLTMSGNPVPLTTQFEVLVDGTNGNTELKPVIGKLGETNIVTSGFVVKKDGETRKTIELDANIEAGRLHDVLLLSMKGRPMMSGTLRLNTKILIPPLDEKVKEKLILDGEFEISDGIFLQSKIQSKIDGLSRRGQGDPDNHAIDEIVHRMSGTFQMNGGTIRFPALAFAIPGAAVNIGGDYDLVASKMDFHGALLLDAKVSETLTGWKRWVLKPVDPFFSKDGAGTFLHIKVTGDGGDPQFGLDPGGTSPDEEAERANEERVKEEEAQGGK